MRPCLAHLGHEPQRNLLIYMEDEGSILTRGGCEGLTIIIMDSRDSGGRVCVEIKDSVGVSKPRRYSSSLHHSTKASQMKSDATEVWV